MRWGDPGGAGADGLGQAGVLPEAPDVDAEGPEEISAAATHLAQVDGHDAQWTPRHSTVASRGSEGRSMRSVDGPPTSGSRSELPRLLKREPFTGSQRPGERGAGAGERERGAGSTARTSVRNWPPRLYSASRGCPHQGSARTLRARRPGLVRGDVRGAHAGPGRGVGRDRRRPQHAHPRPHRQWQDPGRVPVVPRPPASIARARYPRGRIPARFARSTSARSRR